MKIKQAIGNYKKGTKSVCIVVARFNEFITRRLMESSIEALKKVGYKDSKIDVVWVPGALEVPMFVKKAGKKKKYEGVIAIACVIRGDTYHYECVSREVTRGVSQAALETGCPVTSAILTVDNLDQAIDRAGLKAGNKGSDAALGLVEIMNLNKKLFGGRST